MSSSLKGTDIRFVRPAELEPTIFAACFTEAGFEGP